MDWEKVLKSQYQQNHIDDIADEDLLDEAIALLEALFKNVDQDKLLNHHRDWAIPYLALKYVKSKNATE